MNFNWIFLALLSTLTTGIGAIGLKLIDNSKYDNIIFLALTFMFMGIFSFFYLVSNNKIKTKLLTSCDRHLIFFVILFAILLILNNIVIQYAFKFSPNIGYSHIIINLNVIITLLAAYYLFKQNLDFRCLIGIIVSLIGIFIIAYYSKIFLLVLLFFIFLEMLNEFYIIQNKIFKFNKIKLFITIFFTLIYLLFLVLLTWSALSDISNIYKIPFIFVILVCIATDVGGFIIGKLFKGKKLTKISPNKTYSGMFGSFIFSILIGLFFFSEIYPTNKILIFATLVSFVSQIGDLFVSYLKRKINIKDTGNIIPGHGGLLDRFDGLIFSIPLILFINLF